MRFAGLILISLICLVISLQAESLQTLWLAHAAGMVATDRLLIRSRSGSYSTRSRAKRNRTRDRLEQIRSQRTAGLVSLLCLAIAFAFLGSLAGTSRLEGIETTLRESYRPERSDLVVGYGSVLGIAAAVLLVSATSVSFGLFPMHGPVLNSFESSPASISGMTALLQRMQASVVLWKVVVVGMPGFESTVLLLFVVSGALSCVVGSFLACRSESLRMLAGSCWITWGGIVLVAAGAGLTADAPSGDHVAWQFPTGLETAVFSLVVSAVALASLMFIESWLTCGDRPVDFEEDLTGFGRGHRLPAAALGCALLTFSAIPPLPGFWSVLFIVGNAFLPGVESMQGAALVPDASVLSGTALMVFSLLVLAGRSIDFLSVIFLREPIRRISIRGRWLPCCISAIVLGLLLWAGMGCGTLIAWIHQLPT